jgi:hypothetical protein
MELHELCVGAPRGTTIARRGVPHGSISFYKNHWGTPALVAAHSLCEWVPHKYQFPAGSPIEILFAHELRVGTPCRGTATQIEVLG